ncbi:unnamed protein product [Nesidiocoris tenuis]|uniref:Uncharacterized protein n=1 Tax=Nesidiocoris tenuis TaxID=355587 RepID=A0A6H5H4X4_9HEMI|nr:unnamed protein product [Nesidiocoris tenuis]
MILRNKSIRRIIIRLVYGTAQTQCGGSCSTNLLRLDRLECKIKMTTMTRKRARAAAAPRINSVLELSRSCPPHPFPVLEFRDVDRAVMDRAVTKHRFFDAPVHTVIFFPKIIIVIETAPRCVRDDPQIIMMDEPPSYLTLG